MNRIPLQNCASVILLIRQFSAIEIWSKRKDIGPGLVIYLSVSVLVSSALFLIPSNFHRTDSQVVRRRTVVQGFLENICKIAPHVLLLKPAFHSKWPSVSLLCWLLLPTHHQGEQNIVCPRQRYCCERMVAVNVLWAFAWGNCTSWWTSLDITI